MKLSFIEKRERLSDPVATTGDRLYVICSQNGLFPTPWSRSHVPHEGWGVWAHPIKLLDGFWFALRNRTTDVTTWLLEADACRVYGAYTEFDYRVDPLRVTRRDFVPDGLVGLTVTLTVTLPADFSDELELIALIRSDLRPAWLGETVGMHDGTDQVESGQQHLIFRDEANPWFALVGSNAPVQDVRLGEAAAIVQPAFGQGATAQLHLHLAQQTVGSLVATVYIAGSSSSEADALAAYERLQTEHDPLVRDKQDLYVKLANEAHFHSPDAAINAAFLWSKFTTQMLVRQTPTYGPGVGAGLPVYPWWFGIDTEYAVLPMVQSGRFDLAKATLRLLKTVSTEHNHDEPGRVIHELSTTGVVYNPGNLVETPAFTRAVYQTWRWSGDRAFLEEMYPFCKAGMLDYVLGRCDPDGDLCPAGRSIIETLEMHADFECIDIASYTWEALTFLAEMARILDDTATLVLATTNAATLAETIRNDWWLADEGLFADVRATGQEVQAVLQRIDQLQSEPDWEWLGAQVSQAHRLFDAQISARVDGPQDIKLAWLLRHWVVMCPVEVGIATPEQAERTFQRLLSTEFCNEWGMMLHPERRDVMSINTGLLALALSRYGRIEEALKLVQQTAATLNLRTPGAISEALPDQWCFLQLWSTLPIISPLVEGVLGIDPNAGEQTLQVIPHLPTGWPEATLERLAVGDQTFTITAKQSASEYSLHVQADGTEYKGYALTVGFYLPANIAIVDVQVNGHSVPWRWETTKAGRRLVCEAVGQAELIIKM